MSAASRKPIWCNSPYSACGRIGHALDLHMARQRWAGRESFDDSYHYVKELVDGPYQSGTGYWGGSEADFINRTSGNRKILCTYARFVLRERVRRGATRGPQPLRPASRSGKRTRLENRVTVGTFIGE